jgi:hypothetical protein
MPLEKRIPEAFNNRLKDYWLHRSHIDDKAIFHVGI